MQALKRKYESLQEERTAQQHVCELLRTRPEAEAMSIFRRLQGGERPEDIMRHVQHGDLLLQLSLRPDFDDQAGGASSEPFSESRAAPRPSHSISAVKAEYTLAGQRTADRATSHFLILGITLSAKWWSR